MNALERAAFGRGVSQVGVIGEELLAHHREIAVVAELLHDLVEVLLRDVTRTNALALARHLVARVKGRNGKREARAVLHTQTHGLAWRIELDDLAHARRRVDEGVLLGGAALEVLVCLVLVA